MPAPASLRPLCELTQDELTLWCESHGEPAYRATQIRRWLFQRRAADMAAMNDLPAPFRSQLADDFVLLSTHIIQRIGASDQTEKLLLELNDGNCVECVLMQESKRRTACISTQVGCAMGCSFCASGLHGLERNLSSSEILEQLLHLDRLLPPGERLTNLVVMGIGEPLANLPALLSALQTVGEPTAMGLGARRVTISTVGLPDKMRELAQVGRAYNLAVSLHAPNDELRNQLVSVNRRIGIQAILTAADDYFRQTGRRVTYEYVLLGGINDEPKHARQLAAMLRHRNAHVNLIPMNAVESLGYARPTAARVEQFHDILVQAGVATTLRKRKGAEIDAACGQLRLSHTSSPSGAG